MRKTVLILLLVFICFLLEFFIFNIAGSWFMPNFLLLLIIFLNLSWGIRYSLLSAVFAGLIKDGFSSSTFGIYTFSFVFCAYLTTVFSKFLYHKGSALSRMILVAIVTAINVLVHYVLQMMFVSVNIFQVIQHILIPEILTTLLVSTITFQYLRKCVLKLSVFLP